MWQLRNRKDVSAAGNEHAADFAQGGVEIGHVLERLGGQQQVKARVGVCQSGQVLGANAVLMDAYNTDVRPLLAEVRQESGLDGDPLAAYRASGWQTRIIAERVGGEQAGWGA